MVLNGAVMRIFRLLAVSFLLSAPVLSLHAQTELLPLLPMGWRYIRIPTLQNPFSRPGTYLSFAFLKDEANLTGVIVPAQFRLYDLQTRTEGFTSAKRFSFAEPKRDFMMVCSKLYLDEDHAQHTIY